MYDIQGGLLWYYVVDYQDYYQDYLIKESAIKLQHDVVAVLWKAFRNSPLRQVRMEKYPWK